MACRPSTPTSLRPRRRPTSSSRPQARHAFSRPPCLQLLHARLSIRPFVRSSFPPFPGSRPSLFLPSFLLLSSPPVLLIFPVSASYHKSRLFISSLTHHHMRTPPLHTLRLLRYTLSLMSCLSQQVGRAERARKRKKGPKTGERRALASPLRQSPLPRSLQLLPSPQPYPFSLLSFSLSLWCVLSAFGGGGGRAGTGGVDEARSSSRDAGVGVGMDRPTSHLPRLSCMRGCASGGGQKGQDCLL